MASPEAKRLLNRARATASDRARRGEFSNASSTLLSDLRAHDELSAWLDHNPRFALRLMQAQGDIDRYEEVLNSIDL